jgi:GNAT superfamily N-acetyltransferase
MTGAVTVRQAGPQDAKAVMLALSEGCLDEAVFGWVVPDEPARRTVVAGWTAHADDWVGGMLESGVLLVAQPGSGEIAGLSVWELVPEGGPAAPPAGSPAAAAEFAWFTLAYGAEHAPRMALVSETTRGRHPRREAHWHLQQMVVVPAWRGHGLGGAMLRHQLAKADAAGVGAYLEASSPRNRALYERHGFRAHGDPIWLPDGGPGLQPMWRVPAPSAA